MPNTPRIIAAVDGDPPPGLPDNAERQFGARRGGNSRRGACSCERVGL